MDADGRNETDIFRYADVEYTPEGYSDVYRWDDFLGIAGGHVLSAKCIVDSVSPGGEFEGDEPEYAYACEIVGCCGLRDGVALLRPVSHGGNDLIQIAFLRNDVDDATGALTMISVTSGSQNNSPMGPNRSRSSTINLAAWYWTISPSSEKTVERRIYASAQSWSAMMQGT